MCTIPRHPARRLLRSTKVGCHESQPTTTLINTVRAPAGSPVHVRRIANIWQTRLRPACCTGEGASSRGLSWRAPPSSHLPLPLLAAGPLPSAFPTAPPPGGALLPAALPGPLLPAALPGPLLPAALPGPPAAASWRGGSRALSAHAMRFPRPHQAATAAHTLDFSSMAERAAAWHTDQCACASPRSPLHPGASEAAGAEQAIGCGHCHSVTDSRCLSPGRCVPARAAGQRSVLLLAGPLGVPSWLRLMQSCQARLHPAACKTPVSMARPPAQKLLRA